MQHLDEGTIHAWLDGALAPDESQRVEAHAVTCETCSALVAEARGLIAASSRILTALDEVPSAVIPVREGERAVTGDDLAVARARKAVAELSRRRRWWVQRRVLAVAGIAFVAAGTFAVWRQDSFRKATTAAFDSASAVAPPAPLPAPAASPAEPDRMVSTKSDAQLGAAQGGPVGAGGAVGARDGRTATAKEAKLRARDLSAEAERTEAASLNTKSELDRQRAATEDARREKPASVPPQIQQANVQAPPPQLAVPPQQIPQRQIEGRQQGVTDQASQVRSALADSLRRRQALALQEVVVTGATTRADVSAAKARSSPLFAGCYEITPTATVSALRLPPTAIALDTVVAAQLGDTTWYRARSLTSTPVDVELSWRLQSITNPTSIMVEIMGRRGEFSESVQVALSREARRDAAVAAAPSPAESRTLSSRAVIYTARQTSCPRR